ALLAVLTPVIIGFGMNYLALGAFLAAVILTGQLMANFLSNSGGAWDNAKKYIEDGHEGGKGSEAHKAAVIGDTVGDPFKDTAGPALNPLIKVMNLVSLLILPAVITERNNNGVRFSIAGVSLAILLVSIAFSKRKVSAEDSMTGGSPEPVMPEPEVPANADELTPSGLVKGRPDEELVVAIDQWITEAGNDEHEMRARLMEVRLHLEDKT
ncbi:MAG TPA: sodium/proton-translocating pyrophosphatase, partial [Acidimicrobiales bacterium]